MYIRKPKDKKKRKKQRKKKTNKTKHKTDVTIYALHFIIVKWHRKTQKEKMIDRLQIVVDISLSLAIAVCLKDVYTEKNQNLLKQFQMSPSNNDERWKYLIHLLLRILVFLHSSTGWGVGGGGTPIHWQ